MQGIVYKQWYASVSDNKTPMLNVKHLAYIATKQAECEFNNGCAFSLWGNVGDGTGTIYDWQKTKQILSAESKAHKLVYRAVLSLDADTSQHKDYTSRESWQKITESHLVDIAKQHDIKPQNLRWVASYHAATGHPHTHIMFWDASDALHNEYIPPQNFERMTENIRAAFNKEIFAEEIFEYREKNKIEKTLLNTEIESLLKDIKVENTELSWINERASFSEQKFNEIGKELVFLATHLPNTGNLSYKYLPPALKMQTDKIIDLLLTNKHFKLHFAQMMENQKEILSLYGNTDNRVEKNIEYFKKDYYKDYGNKILQHIKDNFDAYKEFATEIFVPEEIKIVVAANLKTTSGYADLIKHFPSRITPRSVYSQNEQYKTALSSVIKELYKNDVVSNYLIKIKSSDLSNKELGKEVAKMIYAEVDRHLRMENDWEEQVTVNAGFTLASSMFKIFASKPPRTSKPQTFRTKGSLSLSDKKEMRKKMDNKGFDWGD